ncbi:sensor histidine kinase [Phytohabitans kaempferiae]|uniref:histidine kinase n=1 Tax=Phytohabitans kaempferiae TaxID=1620943 RepID=A0ABV6ME42_9ACTN
MPESPDYAALIAGQAVVIEMANSGASGLPMVGHLLGLGQRALHADGMAFVEYGPSGGRIIAASGATDWALGRPVDPGDPAVVRLITGPPSSDLPVEALDGALALQLRARGVHRAIHARTEIGGATIGSLYAYFADRAGAATEHHSLMTYLASCIAHLYGDQAGLPTHGNGPVVAALADGLAVVDRDLRIRLWNPAAEQVTRIPADKMLGERLPFPVPAPGQVLDHRLDDGRWLKITAGELPGAYESRVVTFRDTTDQYRRDHDRDLFVAVTSHELRTPVTVIKGYADTLSNHWGSLSELDRLEAARVIGLRAGELARLVDRLLSAANDGGQVGGAPPTPFDLVDALRTAAGALPADLRRRLVLTLPDDLPKALGDRASMTTVLTELATNAEKYSNPGTIIEVTAEAEERTVVFRVSDRGIGVRPEHVERAFDRFWQGEQGDRRRYPGTGLGLYLVRRIVERQNGWVSLRPRTGGGTVAEVRLPRG